MVKIKVYLAGGIHQKDFEDANSWRTRATIELNKYGFKVINPLRNRDWIQASEQNQFTVNEIVHRDVKDITVSHILLVELEDANRNYIGTTTEMTLARMMNKLIIVFTGNREYSPWVDFLATKVVSSLEEALEYIRITLGDETIW